jgi:hypothetical protein
VRSSQTCRAFSSTVQLASKVPEPENMRQAHRPRMQLTKKRGRAFND